MTKNMMLFFGIILSVFFHTASLAFDILGPLRWLKQKCASKQTVTRSIGIQEMNGQMLPVLSINQVGNVQHTKRDITFENDIPALISGLKDMPGYEDLPNLIDQAIIVDGKAIAPGSTVVITTYDDQCMVTIKLYKGIAKLIYSMEQGTLRGILLRLLKHIEPWLQWQYHVPCNIGKNIDVVQLSEVILYAYTQATQNSSAVNHRFKWVLVVELSLNKELNIN